MEKFEDQMTEYESLLLEFETEWDLDLSIFDLTIFKLSPFG